MVTGAASLINPRLDGTAAEPPLPTDLEGRDLAALSERIDGLLRDAQELRHFRDRQDGVIHQARPPRGNFWHFLPKKGDVQEETAGNNWGIQPRLGESDGLCPERANTDLVTAHAPAARPVARLQHGLAQRAFADGLGVGGDFEVKDLLLNVAARRSKSAICVTCAGPSPVIQE
jgi:hypothetical protein